jgi:hypothetical protein
MSGTIGGLYIGEIFIFEKKTYGILHHVDDPEWIHVVGLNILSKESMEWEILTPTMEKAIRYFYDTEIKQKKREN